MTEPFNFLRKKTHKRNISKKTRKRNIKKNKKTRNKQYGGTVSKEQLIKEYENPLQWIRKMNGYDYKLLIILRRINKASPLYNWDDFDYIYNKLPPNFDTYSDIKESLKIDLKNNDKYPKETAETFTLNVFNSYKTIVGKPKQRLEPTEPTDRKILGMGMYGLIVSPAFPNGKTFTNNTISKIFISKNDKDKIIKFVETVKEKIPLLDIDITGYRQIYTVSNANKNRITYKGSDTSIQTELKKIHNQQPNKNIPITPNSMIYQVRMPNLGFSCSDINNNKTLYDKMRSIDYRIISMEILKLLCTVRQIHRNGYIHGDVREPNIMCNLNTGKLTIIDFDWFNTIEDFYKKYPSYYYSHPPECVVIFERHYIDYILDNIEELVNNQKIYNIYLNALYNKKNITTIRNNIRQKLTEYQNKGVEYENKGVTYKNVKDNTYKNILYNDISRFIDSWGLMLGIYYLIKNAWSSIKKDGREDGREDGLKKMYEYIIFTLIGKMLHPDMNQRWDATTGIQEYYTFLNNEISEFCSSYLKDNPKVNDELQSMK